MPPRFTRDANRDYILLNDFENTAHTADLEKAEKAVSATRLLKLAKSEAGALLLATAFLLISSLAQVRCKLLVLAILTIIRIANGFDGYFCMF